MAEEDEEENDIEKTGIEIEEEKDIEEEKKNTLIYISILITGPLIMMMLFMIMNIGKFSIGGLGIVAFDAFEKRTFFSNNGYHESDSINSYSLVTADMNNDGKTDLIKVITSRYKNPSNLEGNAKNLAKSE